MRVGWPATIPPRPSIDAPRVTVDADSELGSSDVKSRAAKLLDGRNNLAPKRHVLVPHNDTSATHEQSALCVARDTAVLVSAVNHEGIDGSFPRTIVKETTIPEEGRNAFCLRQTVEARRDPAVRDVRNLGSDVRGRARLWREIERENLSIRRAGSQEQRCRAIERPDCEDARGLFQDCDRAKRVLLERVQVTRREGDIAQAGYIVRSRERIKKDRGTEQVSLATPGA